MIHKSRSDKFRMAALIFNFLAGLPVSEVPGYEEPLSADEAVQESQVVALEEDARIMAWLLGSPKEDEEDEEGSFKISRADDNAEEGGAEEGVAEEEGGLCPPPRPKRLCFRDL